MYCKFLTCAKAFVVAQNRSRSLLDHPLRPCPSVTQTITLSPLNFTTPLENLSQSCTDHTHLDRVSTLIHLPAHVGEFISRLLSNKLINRRALVCVKLFILLRKIQNKREKNKKIRKHWKIKAKYLHDKLRQLRHNI